MVQRLCDQCRRDFARRNPIWREQPSYRRILLQGSGEGAACGGRDRYTRSGRSAIHQGSASRLISCSRRRVTMPVYTVHAPVTTSADLRATDRFTFVRDGFHVWAAILGVVWLSWHRPWRALIGLVLLIAVIDIPKGTPGLSGAAILVVEVF